MSEQPPQDPQQPYWQPPGHPPQPGQPYAYQPPPPTPGSATTALILGILGLVLCYAFTSIPAIIVGRNAMKEIDASQGRLGGRGMAQAGFILGIIGTVISALVVLALVLLFAFGAWFASSGVNELCNDIQQDGYSVDC